MPPRKRLDWTETAKADVAETVAWYAVRNPDAARRIKAAIEAAAHDLVDTDVPVTGKPGRRRGTLEKLVGKPAHHTLVYRHRPDAAEILEILHVVHHARDYA